MWCIHIPLCLCKKPINFSSWCMICKLYADGAAHICSPIHMYTHLICKPCVNWCEQYITQVCTRLYTLMLPCSTLVLRYYALILQCYRLMLQCYTLILLDYSYSLPIHTSSQQRYITVLHYMSVPTFTNKEDDKNFQSILLKFFIINLPRDRPSPTLHVMRDISDWQNLYIYLCILRNVIFLCIEHILYNVILYNIENWQNSLE